MNRNAVIQRGQRAREPVDGDSPGGSGPVCDVIFDREHRAPVAEEWVCRCHNKLDRLEKTRREYGIGQIDIYTSCRKG
jgi:hypothetical protein